MAFDFNNPWGGNVWGAGNHAYDRWFDGSEAAVGRKTLQTNRSGLVEDHYYSAEGVFLRAESAGSGKIFVEGLTDSVKMLKLNQVQCANSLYEEVIKSWRRFYQLDLISTKYTLLLNKTGTATFETEGPFGDSQFITVSEQQINKSVKNQLLLNSYILEFAHELIHVWQRSEKSQKHLHSQRYEVIQERELIAYTINFLPNKTSELRLAKYKVGKSAVLEAEVNASHKVGWAFATWEAVRELEKHEDAKAKYASYIGFFKKIKEAYSVHGFNFDVDSKTQFLDVNKVKLLEFYEKSSNDL